MPNVFVEPVPKGDGPITGYQLEFADHQPPIGSYKTQEEAIQAAKKLGHKPLVARVRTTSKGNPDHWRSS